MFKLCCERGAANQTFCGSCLGLLLSTLSFLLLHFPLFRNMDEHHQCQLWLGTHWLAGTHQHGSWHPSGCSGNGRSGAEVKPEQGGRWGTADKLFTSLPLTLGNQIGPS